MSYEDMPAGQELDRLIAEKVMGWKVNPDPRKYRAEAINQWGQPVLCVINVGHGCDAYEEEIFCPSFNIAHAWEALEKMAKSGNDVLVNKATASVPYGLSHYDCDTINIHGKTVVHAWADTAPLAICRAALMAMDAKGEM